MSDLNNINNIENKDLQKLFEDWDKAGVMPHTVMNLNSLLPKKGLTTAAGLVALAGVGLGKGLSFLGKQAFMKRGFLKVLKRIGETEEYIIDGKNAEDFKYMKNLKGGGKISTIKHYDEIKEKILDEIRSDIKEFEDFKNSYNSNSIEAQLNDQGSLVNIVNKYKKFFSNINMNFSHVNSGDSSEDIYNSLQKTIQENLSSSDKFINSIITKFKTKYTIGKDENPNQNKRLDKYVDALNQAWNTVKEEILQKYKKLAIEINRSPEFKKLYDIVTELYQKMPIGKKGANKILEYAKISLMPNSLKFNFCLKNNTIQIIKDSSNNYTNSSAILHNNVGTYITIAIDQLKLKDWDLNSASFNFIYNDGTNRMYFNHINNAKTGIMYELPLKTKFDPTKDDDLNKIGIEWMAKFDVNDNYYPIEGKTYIQNIGNSKDDKIKMIYIP